MAPYYSRLLKLKVDLNVEDNGEARPDRKNSKMLDLDNYNGSVAWEKKSKNDFRQELEQDRWDTSFKKLDIPIHEFEKRFETKPPPKNLTVDKPSSEQILPTLPTLKQVINATKDPNYLQNLDVSINILRK